ncbi:MAG TPA: hypothetical protein VMG41_17285 [Gemmatimonadales bacterium]|nr:hypothetical protein [Gemmatimonadales bacterium]
MRFAFWIPALAAVLVPVIQPTQLRQNPEPPAQSRADSTLPHEPPGLTTIVNEGWDRKTPPGWTLQDCEECEAKVSVVQDPSAPHSPPNVLQFRYSGEVGGEGAGARTRRWPGIKRLYLALWFKHSANWQSNPSGVNKMLYIGTNQGNGTESEGILNYEDATSITFYQQNGIEDHHRMGGGPSVVKGRWHFVELSATASTGGRQNGCLSIWVDGMSVVSRCDIRWKVGDDAVFTGIDLDPILGGGPQRVVGEQFYWVDHLYISGK